MSRTRKPARTPLTGTAAKLQNFAVQFPGAPAPVFVLASSKAAAYNAACTILRFPANRRPLAESIRPVSVPVGSSL